MAGGKVIVHKGDGEHGHEVFTTHVCRHCYMQVVCSPDIGHDPESCPIQPNYTCPDCEPKIFEGNFKFGQRFDDCLDDCKWDEEKDIFKHYRKCAHHYEQIFRDAWKRATAH